MDLHRPLPGSASNSKFDSDNNVLEMKTPKKHLKEEDGELISVKEEPLEIEDEEEIERPLLVLVKPKDEEINEELEERNPFEEDDGIPNVSDVGVEQKKESCSGMVFSSMSCSSLFSRQGHKLIPSRSKPSCGSENVNSIIPYHSVECEASLIALEQPIIHKIELTGESLIFCNESGVSFTESGDLKRPQRTLANERPYYCDMCDASFKMFHHLKRHYRRHTGEHPFSCDVCDASYKDLKNLQYHNMIHTGERPFVCDECGSLFTASSSLNRHKRTHTEARSYNCDECDASFTGYHSFKSHKRTHKGVRTYCCDMCGASFGRSQHLNRHKRTHMGECPYPCNECGASFNTSNRLHYHKRKHARERNVTSHKRIHTE